MDCNFILFLVNCFLPFVASVVDILCRLGVFENMILRQIFGPKKDANGEWRSLHSEELHSLYHSRNIGRVIKSRILGWAGHVARMEREL